ncbi:MAG: hypothetical protein ACI3VZ_00775 [Faecousia sp.]
MEKSVDCVHKFLNIRIIPVVMETWQFSELGEIETFCHFLFGRFRIFAGFYPDFAERLTESARACYNPRKRSRGGDACENRKHTAGAGFFGADGGL